MNFYVLGTNKINNLDTNKEIGGYKQGLLA